MRLPARFAPYTPRRVESSSLPTYHVSPTPVREDLRRRGTHFLATGGVGRHGASDIVLLPARRLRV